MAWIALRLLVVAAGGRAVRLTPAHDVERVEIDALVLSGGADVDPAVYGQEAHDVLQELREGARRELTLGAAIGRLVALPLIYLGRRFFSLKRMMAIDPDRDAFEREALQSALDQGLPVLGICRGAQLLNVHLGGTLHQHLRGFYTETPEVRSILPRKQIRVSPGSRLAELVGGQPMAVNGLHHQAIDRLGDGLVVVAQSTAGVVQAIEDPAAPYLIGVQWHPEFLPYASRQRAIFGALVRAARSAAGRDRRSRS